MDRSKAYFDTFFSAKSSGIDVCIFRCSSIIISADDTTVENRGRLLVHADNGYRMSLK